MKIERLHADFGARITDIDLASPLLDGEAEQVREALDDYSFLCFPGQKLNDDIQLELTTMTIHCRGEGEPRDGVADVP